MNLRPGIDTPPPANFLLAKLNVPFDDRTKMIQVLEDLEAVQREAVDPDREFGGKSVVDGWALNLLVAFGLRFFLGPLADRKPEEAIPNFPPGGVFALRHPTRFDIADRQVPVYLRTMAAAGDREAVAARLASENGSAPTSDAVDEAYEAWLSANESDLLLYIEANTRFLCTDLWDRIRTNVVVPHGLELAMPLDESNARGDGRDLIGWHDPISNMDDLIEKEPQYYRSKIYLPHPAPGFPGENMKNRDELRYDGGTYLVHRKYALNLEKWNADEFSITDSFGRTFTGEEARNRALGRDRVTGRVIRGSDGALLEPEYDSQEANLASVDAHIIMARGGSPAPFAGPFPPVAEGDTTRVPPPGCQGSPPRRELARTRRRDRRGHQWSSPDRLPEQHPADGIRVHQQHLARESGLPASRGPPPRSREGDRRSRRRFLLLRATASPRIRRRGVLRMTGESMITHFGAVEFSDGEYKRVSGTTNWEVMPVAGFDPPIRVPVGMIEIVFAEPVESPYGVLVTAERSLQQTQLVAANYGNVGDKGFVVYLWETIADRTVVNGGFSFAVLQGG